MTWKRNFSLLACHFLSLVFVTLNLLSCLHDYCSILRSLKRNKNNQARVDIFNSGVLEDTAAWPNLSGMVTGAHCALTCPPWHKEHTTCWAPISTGQASDPNICKNKDFFSPPHALLLVQAPSQSYSK